MKAMKAKTGSMKAMKAKKEPTEKAMKAKTGPMKAMKAKKEQSEDPLEKAIKAVTEKATKAHKEQTDNPWYNHLWVEKTRMSFYDFHNKGTWVCKNIEWRQWGNCYKSWRFFPDSA